MTKFTSKLAPLLEQYAKYRQASQRWSNSSQITLRAFDRYCSEHFPEDSQLTQEMVDNYFKKRPTETINSSRERCSNISEFIKYLQSREMTEIKVPERPKKQRRTYIPHAFCHEELEKFFNACDSLCYKPWRLDSKIRSITAPVIFRLIYSTGMRTVEARLLRRDNVNLSDGTVSIVNTKGYNEHYIVLHDSMLEVMRIFDKTMERLLPDRQYFFSSHKNKPLNSHWLTDNFRVIWDSVNNTHATAYDLRHNYAISNINNWTDEGFDFYDKMAYLSKSMGHVCLESTKYYYSIVPKLNTITEYQTKESFDRIVPEVNTDEKINE